MANKTLREYFLGKGLLPFQADFANSFLEREDLPFRELVSPVGTGKTRTAVALIAFEMEQGVGKRFLVLAPSGLLGQWQSELTSQLSSAKQDTIPRIIDRKAYLDLESQASNEKSPWPIPSTIIMSIDLAKRDDIAASLERVIWDLVVIDESHLLRGKSLALFDSLRISGAAHRALLLTASEPHLQGDAVWKIRESEVVDSNGRQLFPPFKKQLAFIQYHRTELECEFLHELQDFAVSLSYMKSFGKLQGALVTRNAASSVYAVEGMLRRLQDTWKPLRNRIAHGDVFADEDLVQRVQKKLEMVTDIFGDMGEIIEDVEQSPAEITIQLDQFSGLLSRLEFLLDRLNDIGIDSKLSALISYIQESKNTVDKPYLCVLSSFKDTVQYLNTSLQDLNMPIYVINGAMEQSVRQDVAIAFRENGGVLISTDSISAELSLEFVDKCVNYDLPRNPNLFEQRWGRFLRLGRTKDFKMVVLRDTSESLPWEENLIRNLERTFITHDDS